MEAPSRRIKRQLEAVEMERMRQHQRWGLAHDATHTPMEWGAILTDRLGLFARLACRYDDWQPGGEEKNALHGRLIELAATALAAAEMCELAETDRIGLRRAMSAIEEAGERYFEPPGR